ncbi:MAG TPA: polyphosphate kinase 2 family protein [Acidimicrobiia bacterium]|nr:polyphosphate kinase 2 family protein [Acidimicrobiia bacterium]
MDQYRIVPGTTVDLSQRDPRDTSGFDGGKEDGKKQLEELATRLEALQELMYAEGERRLLVVLQAMDTGGKDGTIRHVFEGVNPQGVDVTSFKKPGAHELARDYLWRVHQHVPEDGEIMIFNRSHYEDVLVVRVHSLVPEERWSRRFDHINHFERMLADEGTTILKFFLHISKKEQAERLQSRLDEPDKHWKFSRADLAERSRWDEYVAAYEDAIARTSTEWAPWYVVPSDRKWYRNLVVAGVLVDTLEGFGMEFPQGDDLSDVVIE